MSYIPTRKPRTVADLVAEARGGLVASAIGRDLADLIEACEVSGKPGTLTISLKVVPHGRDNREMHIHTTHKCAKPYDPNLSEANIYFVNGPSKDLVRDDPAAPQQTFSAVRAVDEQQPQGEALPIAAFPSRNG